MSLLYCIDHMPLLYPLYDSIASALRVENTFCENSFSYLSDALMAVPLCLRVLINTEFIILTCHDSDGPCSGICGRVSEFALGLGDGF